MFKTKFLKKKPKTKKDKPADNPTSVVKETLYDVIPPNLPDKPIPKLPPRKYNTGRVYNKEAIGDLPLQHVSSNRRMEDLDDNEYGYTTGGTIYSQPKKKEFNFEDVFMDAQQFVRYQEHSATPMISRVFFSPQGKYDDLSVTDISQQMDSASEVDQQDLKKFIVTGLLPDLKANNKIIDIFTLLSCKNKSVRSLCIQELTEAILEIDHKRFSREDLMKLYEAGTGQLFSAITETKKTFSVFQPLIHLGIIFNCFIYLKAIEAMDDWIACIQRVMSTIQSKMKRVTDRSDPDVRVFAETAKCIFELDKVDLDDSLLLGEDEDDFLPEFSREDGDIYIEGLASLFHTGNLILRQQSKFKSGVQRLVRMASFMNGSTDEGMVKWFHRLLGQFVLQILFQEHDDVKLEVLDQCEDDLLSILRSGTLHHEGFGLTHSLLFHHKERLRSRYREIAKTRCVVFSKAIIDVHIQNLMNKCGLAFDVSTIGSQLNKIVERKQCTFCNEEASITCIYEGFPEESTDDVDMYNNTSTVKIEASQNPDRKSDLENELEVLKQIESKDFHRNVARLLAFNQSFPKFYIKERLPGDNLQRRLLEARDKDKIIPIFDLIRIIIQAVEGVIYVHSNGCLVRDITTASFGCTITNNGYFLKLKNFEMAAKHSDFSNDGIISGLIDLDFSGVPIRWAAPESLLEGHYSIYSDVWSVNILADEILNYAAWPYSDISDADINDMVINIVFTHLKPQGFNRPRRVQGLILEGLANVPEQRLKLEALRMRLLEILDNVDGGGSCTLYDTYSGVEGSSTKTYEIPPLIERQTIANSIFERGIPPSIQRYRELDEDPVTAFAMEVAERNRALKEQSGIDLLEISSDENYKIESEDRTNQTRVTERVTDDFLKYTYNRLKEIDSRKMCVEPWPPTKSVSADGIKLHYRIPRSAHLLDIVLHKYRGETIGPYIELLYELANHVDSFHAAGWIFRCLRAKTVWILEIKEKEQTIVVPKFGKYRRIISADYDTHLEQIRVENREDVDGIQWLPIEAIKAGLYSKESDVYAFGMITWEVMSAFGQEGVVYDQDEERELTCIPFNYQQSENILQHLIEGYIPEKPVKCPDWFYQEVTRPCLLHQKIDRPSMKTILQILQSRLHKTLPKQVLSLPPIEPEISKDTYQYEDLYDYDDTVSPTLPQSSTEESKSEDTAKSRTPVSIRPPPLPMRYHNLNEKEGQKDEHCRLRPPPLPPPKPRNLKLAPSDTSDSWAPPAPCADNIHLEENQGQKNDSPPSVPKRPSPTGLQEHSEEAILSDVNSCKSLPLPNIPEQKDEGKGKYVNVRNPNTKLNPPSAQNRLPLPPKPTKYNTQNNLQIGCKDSAGRKDNLNPARESDLDKNSNLQLPLPPPVNQSLESDKQNTNKREQCNLDSVLKSSDFDAEVNSSNQMRDTYKGSDFYHVNPSSREDDTQKGSDFDLSVRIKNKLTVNSDEAIKKNSEIKTKPKILPKPKVTWYVNSQENEKDNMPSVTPVYVNEEEAKPAIPPRKPCSK